MYIKRILLVIKMAQTVLDRNLCLKLAQAVLIYYYFKLTIIIKNIFLNQ